MSRRQAQIGDEYTAVTEDAPHSIIRIVAIDQSNGNIIVVDAEAAFGPVTAISVDDLNEFYGGGVAAVQAADEDAGFREFGKRYATAIREKREAFAKRAAEQRDPETIFAEAAAAERHAAGD
jgi:hypothetical protein